MKKTEHTESTTKEDLSTRPDLRAKSYPSDEVLGVRYDNLTREIALRRVLQFASRETESGRMGNVYFTNVHSVHIARRNKDLGAVIGAADLVLPDGSGLSIAGKLFGRPIVENLNGTDFTPQVLAMAEKKNLSVYLLGAKEDILNGCVRTIRANFPSLRIAGSRHGYYANSEEQAVINEINAVRPDILLVAFGSPKQELWIARNAPILNAGVALAVGGLFDFLSGETRRAPVWFRRLGVEWLFRFLRDPRGKWDRVIVEIPEFLIRILARRLSGKPRVAGTPMNGSGA